MTGTDSNNRPSRRVFRWCLAVVIGSGVLGLVLIADQAKRMSATYDEMAYLRVGARWWRTGEQAEISRMGSPLTFFKLQQGPTLWWFDRTGRRDWVNDPITHQSELLPILRIGASWVWLVTLGIVAAWAYRAFGPRAMAMASALYALSPNLLAHGALVTMETPIVACSSGLFFAFWLFLQERSRWAFWVSALVAGLAFSCKFTAVLFPAILALAWAVDLWLREGQEEGLGRKVRAVARVVIPGMIGYGLVMVAANLAVTGLATIPLRERPGIPKELVGKFSPGAEGWIEAVLKRSYPQDWVGFFYQISLQRSGGLSYLFGERRLTGWWYYYLVCLAVKVPLGFWWIFAGRAWWTARDRSERTRSAATLAVFALAFLLAAMFGSKRNFGVRYLLPVAAPALVWVSVLAERGRWSTRVAGLGLAGMAVAVAAIHPHELTYFNAVAGGPIGGRHILADSNLDWGQGARSLAKLQRERPEFADLTLFYFGDTDPDYYGVVGLRYLIDGNTWPADLPPGLAVDSPFLAVSASLQWGPLGPEGYFRPLDHLKPVAMTDDTTIAIYRTGDLTNPINSATSPSKPR